MSRLTGPIIGLTAIASFLIGVVVAGTRPPLPMTALPVLVDDSRPLTIAAAGGDAGSGPVTTGAVVDFGAVAARINAAVVNVDTARRVGDERGPYRRYAPDDANPREGSGSGFIIDPSGFILTNHHVVTGADRVTVTLSDRRSFRADIIGVDPAIDVALLKVHSADPLPVAELGNSDLLRVGEWVCAIGNPLGVYVHSVTVGVVSFLGRKLFDDGDDGLDAFIQTDAAISFGNSGGPLINARGEVVGITTAISERAPNIGFAVPISQVVSVLPQLREHGTVARGSLAARFRDVTPALRRALHIGPEQGALIEDVTPDSPADHAGLRMYDVVVRVDRHAVQSGEELTRYISARAPGTLAAIEVWRDGDTRVLQVKLRDRPLPAAIRKRMRPETDIRPAVQERAPLGIVVRDLDTAWADRLRIPDTIQGVVVTEIDPAGPARLAMVRANQIILEVNRRRVASSAGYRAVVDGLKRNDPVALLVYDRGSNERILCVVDPDAEQ